MSATGGMVNVLATGMRLACARLCADRSEAYGIMGEA
jgi:hypothetical protein